MCVFHLHTIDTALKKKSPRVIKTQGHETIKNHVDVLGRIYGQTHLLSSERQNNIADIVWLFKYYF